MLLAAGRGTRLRPLTSTLPKPALPVLGIPLGAFGLELLAQMGGSVALNLSHLATEAREALAPWLTDSVRILDEGDEPYGTAGTLRALRVDLAPTFMTVNGDLLCDTVLNDLLDHHRKSGMSGTLLVEAVPRGADLSVADGVVTGFIDRRIRPEASGYRYLGIAAFERRILSLIPRTGPVGLGEVMLRPLAELGALAVVEHRGYALDVGTPARYLCANLDLLAGRGPRPPSPYPGDILEVEGGRAFVGRGARVAAEHLGPGAVVLEGATVARRVERALVWSHEDVPPGPALTDSIWFQGVALAPN